MRFVSKKSTFPPLGLLTVAAMLPQDWELKLVDLNLERLTEQDLRWADYVMISAMIVHKPSVRKIVAQCAEVGVPLIAGGPLFTTDHQSFPEIQHFVLGEAEAVMPKLVADMLAGTVKRLYQVPGRPNVTKTPVPRWDLVNLPVSVANCTLRALLKSALRVRVAVTAFVPADSEMMDALRARRKVGAMKHHCHN